MANPITFRNVANTVVGDPARALRVAQDAFGRVGKNANDSLDRIRLEKADERATNRQDLTDQGLQALFPDVNAPAGADIGAIINQINNTRAADDLSARSGLLDKSTQLSIEQLQREATPEALALAEARANRKDALGESRVQAQVADTQQRTERLAFDRDRWQRTVDQAKTVDEARAQAQLFSTEAQDAGAEDTDQYIQETLDIWDQQNTPTFSADTPTDVRIQKEQEFQDARSKQVQALEDSRQNWVNDYVAERIPEAYAKLIKSSKGKVTLGDIAGTDIGIALGDARQLSKENAAKVYATAEKRRARAIRTAKSPTRLWNMGLNTDGTWKLLSEDEAGGNELSTSDAEDEIAGIFRNRDIQPDNMDTDRAKDILRTVGGNRQAFRSIFQNNSVVEPGYFDDKINWDNASKLAKTIKTSMTGAARAAGKVASTGAYISRAEHQRRVGQNGANSVFLNNQDSTAISPEAGTVEAVTKEITDRSTIVKDGIAQVMENFDSLSDEVKKRYTPEVQTIERILDSFNKNQDTDNPYNNLKDAEEAYQRALKALSFMKEQDNILSNKSVISKAEKDALNSLFKE